MNSDGLVEKVFMEMSISRPVQVAGVTLEAK